MFYGDTLRLSASATDPDGDPIRYSVAAMASLSEIRTGYSAAMHMDPSTGDFWFTPGPRDIPSRSFQFKATDAEDLTDTTNFKVTVVVP